MRYFGSRFVLSAADQQTSLQDWTISAEASGLLHQEGLDPVVMTLQADPIGNGDGGLGYLEPLAEGPGEAFQ